MLINNSKDFDIFNILPNPVTDGCFNLYLTSGLAIPVEIKIMDMQGRVVDKQTRNIIAGLNSLSINVEKLASGAYAISATTEK